MSAVITKGSGAKQVEGSIQADGLVDDSANKKLEDNKESIDSLASKLSVESVAGVFENVLAVAIEIENLKKTGKGFLFVAYLSGSEVAVLHRPSEEQAHVYFDGLRGASSRIGVYNALDLTPPESKPDFARKTGFGGMFFAPSIMRGAEPSVLDQINDDIKLFPSVVDARFR